MSQVLRLGFTDYFLGLDEFFIDTFSKRYEVVRDDVNPDYLIFCDETFGEENKKFNNRENLIKIFYTGENRRPWNYRAHFAITFDHYDISQHYRLPLYVIDHWIMVNKLKMLDMEKVTRSENDIAQKTKFCSFISSNVGAPKRNEFFQKLLSYKQVDAAGQLFNNIGYVIFRGIEAAFHKNEFMKPYKFNLCFESSSFPGYCTEKLFHALYMKTVPIYWGSPTAALDFNPKAFLNWHDYLDDEKFLQKIIEIDQNEHKYRDMFMQPMFPENGNRYVDLNRFLDWFHKNVYRGVLK